MIGWRQIAGAACVSVGLGVSVCVAQVGTPPGYFVGISENPYDSRLGSTLTAISSDGRVAAGVHRSWRDGGATDAVVKVDGPEVPLTVLGSPANTYAGLSPAAVTSDGHGVLGKLDGFQSPIFWNDLVPFMMSTFTGCHTHAIDMSNDGMIAVGWDSCDGPVVWRWNGITRFQSWSATPLAERFSPFGISGDGRVIFGYRGSEMLVAGVRPCVWTAESGFQDLTDPTGVVRDAYAWRASDDGSVVIVNLLQGGGFLWERGQVSSWLPPSPSAIPTEGFAVSGDGLTVALAGENGYRAIWRRGQMPVHVSEAIAADGLNAPGWSSLIVRGISFDGRVLVGEGTNPCGNREGWIWKRPVMPLCLSDFNASGVVSVQDIFDFLESYFGGDRRADWNGSCEISVQDIFDFLAAYFAGCP